MTVCISGQTFIVVQQQSNANNTSLSPHYGNSVAANPDSGQSFANVNWSQSEPQRQEDYHKNMNGIGDKLGVAGGRRTPYNSIDLPNGSIYHSFNESQTNGNSINNPNNISNNNNNNTNVINNNNNTKANSKTSISSNTSSSFTPTTSYSTNQSQSYSSSANQDFSSQNESGASLPNLSGRQTQRPSSRSSPARAVLSNSSANSGNKSVDNETMVTLTANRVNSSQSHLTNEQNLENEPFLVNTTTTMHHNHNLSDLTTSMNTSTGMPSDGHHWPVVTNISLVSCPPQVLSVHIAWVRTHSLLHTTPPRYTCRHWAYWAPAAQLW